MSFYFEPKAGRANKSWGGFSQIRRLTGILAGILLLTMLPAPAQAGLPPAIPYSLKLSWDASPTPDVAGYRVYYGAASGNYTDNIAAGNVPFATVSNLLPGITYYFAVTAVGTDGVESDFSNEIHYSQTLPSEQVQIQGKAQGAAGGPFKLTMTGLAGHTYEVEATTDFSTWTVIGTMTSDAGGALSFTDTNAANFSQRFYRTRDTQP